MKLKNAVVSSLVLALSTFAAYSQTKVVRTGLTSVELASGFVSALGSLHVTPSPLGSSELTGATIDFPVLAGVFDTSDAHAEIIHGGGLRLTAGGTVVDLRDFIIDTTGAQPIITGVVAVDEKVVGRITLFNLTITASDVQTNSEAKNLLTIQNVDVTLASGAAATLNSVFHISALKGGLAIGTADVFAVI